MLNKRRQIKRLSGDDLAQAAFLNERNLSNCLGRLFPGETFEQGRVVPNSGLRFKPDFRCESQRLIVEFDGYGHYRNAEDTYWDKVKNEAYAKLGYMVVRIPYFVQPSKDTIRTLFAIECEFQAVYAQGFIHDEVLLPADFCSGGIDKFLEDLDRFDYLKREIIASLQVWVKRLGDVNRVAPRCIQHMLL